jgi:signal transduction histidine kinase
VDAPGSKHRRGLRTRLQDARIRVKLGLILVIPIVAVLGLATDRIVTQVREAVDTELVRSLAELSANASGVAHELHRERMTAAAFLADPTASPEQYIPQIRRTDKAISTYSQLREKLGTVPASVDDRLRRIDQQLSTLDDARQQVLTRADITVSAVVLRYGTVANDLVAYRESIGQIAGDTPLGDALRAAASLSRTKAEMAQSQAVAFVALQSGKLDDEQLTAFLSTQTSEQEALNAFELAATPQQRDLVSATITGNAVALADRAANDVIRSSGGTALITAVDASKALGAVVDLVRWAEELIDNDLLTSATDRRNTVIWQVALDSVAVLVALTLALTLALMLARSLVRSLNQLRLGTLAVANRDLPETVARLSNRQTLGDHTPAEIAAQVPDPIQLSSRDEIGQVASAFNVVHREALRVAAEQAALHTSVSMMFLNLARRSQSLVDQMIAHLDDIERDEQDPKRLGRLFRLDHLATRMRRNDENLLVLAGADSSPPRRDDGLVVDILRAAQSEIEHYDRVEFDSFDSDALVTARAVNDVVRLLAELFDNATRFSPPGSAVVVGARRVGDQVIIQIEDRGVGISPEQVVLFNKRLASPPAVDISAFRMMGLAVSSRLAARYGIRVELRCDTGEGTTVYVSLPSSILILPSARRYDMVGSPRPRQPLEAGPAWGAGTPTRTPVAMPPLPPPPPPLPPVQPPPSWHDMLPAALPSGPIAGNPPLPTRGIGDLSPRSDLGDYRAMPPSGSNGYSTPQPAADETAEMPIYQEMQAAWFRDNRSLDMGTAGTGTLLQSSRPEQAAQGAGGKLPQYRAATGAPPVTYASTGGVPPVGMSTSDGWQSKADDGWRAAMAAAEPPVRTSTRGGLPKRVPQAQLVPGGVDANGPAAEARRSPEDVRGLLSNYHRGVQRGRGIQEPPVSG